MLWKWAKLLFVHAKLIHSSLWVFTYLNPNEIAHDGIKESCSWKGGHTKTKTQENEDINDALIFC